MFDVCNLQHFPKYKQSSHFLVMTNPISFHSHLGFRATSHHHLQLRQHRRRPQKKKKKKRELDENETHLRQFHFYVTYKNIVIFPSLSIGYWKKRTEICWKQTESSMCIFDIVSPRECDILNFVRPGVALSSFDECH